MYSQDLPQFTRNELMAAIRRKARKSQRLYQLLALYQLLLLLVASAVSATSYRIDSINLLFVVGTTSYHVESINLSLVIAAICFAAALSLQLLSTSGRWEDSWQASRAAAEKINSLAWLYAVGGDPFGAANDSGVVNAAFGQQVLEILKETNIRIAPPEGPLITPSWHEIRVLPLDLRRAVYMRYRIADQKAFYVFRAREYRYRTNLWQTFTVLIQVFVILALLARAFDVVVVDLYSVAGALAGAGATYAQNRQFQRLAKEYATHARDIARMDETFRDLEERSFTEEAWSKAVSKAENLISQAVR